MLTLKKSSRLSLLLIIFFITGGLVATTVAQPKEQLLAAATDWHKGYTLIVTSNTDNASVKRTLDYVTGQGGGIAIVVPPHIMLGWIPPELANTLIGNYGIESISYRPVDLSQLKYKDEQIAASVSFFNAVASGSLAQEMQAAATISGQLLVNDVLEAPPLNFEDYEKNLQRIGVAPSLGNSDSMTGTVAVCFFFVESNGAIEPDTYTWNSTDQSNTLNRAWSGLSWWSSQAPSYGTSVTFIVAYVSSTSPEMQQGYEPILHPSTDDHLWINAVMGNLGFSSGDKIARVTAFNTWLKGYAGTNWAYSVFIGYNPFPAPEKFTNGYPAYASDHGGPYSQMLFRSGGSEEGFGTVLAHETGHIFWACDEYYDPSRPNPGCTSCAPCDPATPRPTVPNENCIYCNPGAVPCIMLGNSYDLCCFTPAQIGWSGAVTPRISINDVTVTEGNTGTVTASFRVRLTVASTQVVTVNYATANGTATTGIDYVSGSGTVIFPAGTTGQWVTVQIIGDVISEADETFFVNLSNPNNATICRGQGKGTILDNDPSLTIANRAVNEGDTGYTYFQFSVFLSTAASGQIVTVNYATANSSAKAGTDYVAGSGTLTFPVGTTYQVIHVEGIGDLIDESDETFFVNLSNPTNATIGDGQGLGIIIDDDPSPAITINDGLIAEGNSGTQNFYCIAQLSAASGQTVVVNYATTNGTATAGNDYVAGSDTVGFPEGTTTRHITVVVNGDVIDEPNETFFVNLSNPINATISDGQGQGTIIDNDPPPSISINDSLIAEGNTGIRTFGFTVWLSAASGQTVTVNYATANGTAKADTDYVSTSGTLTFPAGTTAKTIFGGVYGDVTVEADETFFVNLTSPTNATIADGQGQGTILNDDAPPVPSLSINDVALTEGNSGTKNFGFTVSLSAASTQPVTVHYATANGTATAGTDYIAGSGMLTFPAGTTTQPITVVINGDGIVEPNETFFVNLTSPTNATLADNQGLGTITNDDVAPTNLALNKPAAASSSNSSYPPQNANDGSITTHWRSGSLGSNTTAWWRVDLGATCNINNVVINWRGIYYAKKYTVQVSLTGSGWTTVYTDNAGNGGIDHVTFAAVSAHYVRIRMTQNNSGTERINEVEVYATSASALGKAVVDNGSDTAIPDEIVLQQNYPNPFNPSTEIYYSVPRTMHVTLKIYNLAGQEVATLVNEMREAGNYAVTFDASRLTSGVYFSILQAGEARLVRRLVYMK